MRLTKLTTPLLFFTSITYGNAIEKYEDNIMSRLSFSGDVRLRYEYDYHSRKSDGSPRQNRHRARYRFRLESKFNLTDKWYSSVRLRTGNRKSQQSPHLSLLNSTGDKDSFDLALDRYYIKYEPKNNTPLDWVWIGRNSFPFWKPNEIFWDDDVTPTGIAFSTKTTTPSTTRQFTSGAFMLPDGAYGLHQPMIGAQQKWSCNKNKNKFTVATAFYYFDKTNDTASYLLNGNGEREYTIGSLNLLYETSFLGKPVKFGSDFYKNFSNYKVGSTDSFINNANKNDNFGYNLYAKLGDSGELGWEIGYMYSDIETFAVNASYAQDDWFRFGNGKTGQTRSSDFKGHEINAKFKLRPNLSMRARWFFVDTISSSENGNRFRLDIDYKF